jgi:hypothetical protein
MTKAEEFRKRADAVSKRMGRRASPTSLMGKKKKALLDMAGNEDWLDGKAKPKASLPARSS